MGDNVYATSLNRTATIFPFLLFSRVCVRVGRLSPFPSSLLATHSVPASGCGGLLGVGGKILSLGDTKKNKINWQCQEFCGEKNSYKIRHIFRNFFF
jgi:hypothetical protein